MLVPLPPKKEDPAPEYLKVPDDIANSPYIYESDIEDNNDGGSVMSAASSAHDDEPKPHEREASVDDTASQQPIKDRRNMSHVPPIVTIHVDQDPNSVEASKNPFTPPQSAVNPATTAPPASINTNPFESAAAVHPEHSPVKTPQSTNPFEMSTLNMDGIYQQQRSTNPFEYESLPESPLAGGLQDPHLMDDNHSVQSAHSEKSEQQHHKHHSWLSSGTHHLGLTLSRRSANSVSEGGYQEEGEGSDLSKTPSQKKHHKFNPFKRILSRSGTDKEDHSQRNSSVSTEGTIEDSHANILLRKDSSRRNAIHGPF